MAFHSCFSFVLMRLALHQVERWTPAFLMSMNFVAIRLVTNDEKVTDTYLAQTRVTL
jgi:hypothetical protein